MDGNLSVLLVLHAFSIAVLTPRLSAAPAENSDYTQLLQASARRIVEEISSLDIIAKRTLDFPLENRSSSRIARLYLKANMRRADVAAEIFTSAKDGADTIVQHTWINAHDGDVTYNLPADSAIFTISPGNTVSETAQFFPGAYIYAKRLDRFLEQAELTYNGAATGADGRLHSFTALQNLPPDKDGNPRFRRHEILASEEYGLAIVSCSSYGEDGRLWIRYAASDFQQVASGLWLPRHAREEAFIGAPGRLTRTNTFDIQFKAVNQPLDDRLFKLSCPPHYTIVDRVHDLVINPSELRLGPDLGPSGSTRPGDITTGSQTIDNPSDAGPPENSPRSNQRDVNEQAAPQRHSADPNARNPWRHRGLILLAMVLVFAAGVMIGRYKW